MISHQSIHWKAGTLIKVKVDPPQGYPYSMCLACLLNPFTLSINKHGCQLFAFITCAPKRMNFRWKCAVYLNINEGAYICSPPLLAQNMISDRFNSYPPTPALPRARNPQHQSHDKFLPGPTLHTSTAVHVQTARQTLISFFQAGHKKQGVRHVTHNKTGGTNAPWHHHHHDIIIMIDHDVPCMSP